jgi:hypothetical protein
MRRVNSSVRDIWPTINYRHFSLRLCSEFAQFQDDLSLDGPVKSFTEEKDEATSNATPKQ